MKNNNIDGFLIRSTDEFLSEYTSEYLNRLKAVTGFTGSNGMALIRPEGKKNAFFTDGRYVLQAKIELGENFEIFNLSELGDIFFSEWVAKNFSDNSIIAFDPKHHSSLMINSLKNKLNKFNITLKPIKNFIDDIWQNRPKKPYSIPFVQPIEYAGKASPVKLMEAVSDMAKYEADYFLITKPESIAWLLNLRGADLRTTPIILCYAIINNEGKISLFTYNHERINNEIIDKIGVKIETYDIDNIKEYIEKNLADKKVLFDQDYSQEWFSSILNRINAKIINMRDHLLIKRAMKNVDEIIAITESHYKDAVAVISSLYEIENTNELDELKIAEILLKHRKQQAEFICESFDTIAGFNEHGAIIHYRADEKTFSKISGNGLLLIDSGGQYLGGTTDITRTILIGKAKEEWIKNYTLTLKGHINLASAIFPYGTTGHQLDSLARIFLWRNYSNYQHGTGHGVGNCLNVHEGPHSISAYSNNQKLEINMITSNEPGIYIENEYGIRIENLMYASETKNQFLEFKQLTLVPYDKNLIDFSLLDNSEKKWLENYYHEIREKILPKINDEKIKNWLEKQLEI